MRLYDIVVLVTPDLSDDDATKLAGEYRKILADGGAKFVKEEPWGRRRLAFPIGRKREANYVYWQVESDPPAVAEAERRMGLSDQVLRHLAVRVDEDLRRAGKMAERIKKKQARRPPRPPAPPIEGVGTATAASAAPPAERSEA